MQRLLCDLVVLGSVLQVKLRSREERLFAAMTTSTAVRGQHFLGWSRHVPCLLLLVRVGDDVLQVRIGVAGMDHLFRHHVDSLAWTMVSHRIRLRTELGVGPAALLCRPESP